MTTLKDLLNRANPNELSNLFQSMRLGDFVRSSITRLWRKAAKTPSPLDQIAAVQTIKLPNDAKACTILRAYAQAGTGTKGELVVDGPMTTATAAGHVGVTAAGDISFASADAWTAVDVSYVPEEVEVVTQQFPLDPAVGDISLPAKWSGRTVLLMRATLDTGTVTGEGKVIQPGARTATTLQVNLNLAKNTVQFLVADAVSMATLTLGLLPLAATDRDTLLEASGSPLI